MIGHEIFMRRCIGLAELGLGNTRPNPLVGAVVVHEGQMIGEGFHERYGGPHAEVNAVAAVSDKSLLGGASLYVNLEPCAHHGKTPPCAEMLVRLGIKRVFIGMKDPYPLVAGKGIRMLEEAGVRVSCGILEEECRELNRRFLTFHEKKRPYILLKWAQSLDGIMGSGNRERLFLTGDTVQKLVHKWRSEEAAILVGPDTALLDNPRLTLRCWKGNQPLRVLVDRHLRVPETHALYDRSSPTVVFNMLKEEKHKNLELIALEDKDFLAGVMERLHAMNIQSVMVEGGAAILEELLRQNLWDEARLIQTDRPVGKGVRAPVLAAGYTGKEAWGKETLCRFRNPG
jgi:diaminohydroxyphosphoribosylaminopyrimidine deaminase/5-amino-6-(5-phosphoribosylamino)uracil reductase